MTMKIPMQLKKLTKAIAKPPALLTFHLSSSNSRTPPFLKKPPADCKTMPQLLHRFPIAVKLSSSASLRSSTTTLLAVAAFGSMTGTAEFDLTGAPTAALVNDFFPVKLQPGVIVYDGVCHLCHRGVKWITSLDEDRKIKFCCLQSKAAEPYLGISGLTREDVLHRFIFIEDPFQYHQGSTAALKVLSYMPLPYSALSYLLVIPEPLRDSFYDYLVNKGCQRLGKEDDCIVLKEIELLDRFIDADELWKRKLSKGG